MAGTIAESTGRDVLGRQGRTNGSYPRRTGAVGRRAGGRRLSGPAAIADHWQRDEAETLAWLSDLTDEELAASTTVNGLEGFPLSTYLVHVAMHGVESFSAAAILLHRAGHSMGDVGFLDFVDAAGPPP